MESAVRAETKADQDRGLLDHALLQLLCGQRSRAIASLELAVSRKPETAVAGLADLSAAYLARFEAEGDSLDLLRSVQAAERGLSLASEQPALLFNRALALTKLGTRTMAERAWREFLGHEASVGWQEEAGVHLRHLRRSSAEEEWEHSLAVLESPSAAGEHIVGIVEHLPAQARSYAEEVLLPRWAAAVSRGDPEAERSLRLAATIGEVLKRVRGEELLADAIASIQATMAEGTTLDRRQALLRGLQDFGYGVAQYNEQNLTSAQGPLSRAVRDLAAVRNPLSFWARFYLSVMEYYVDADRGLATLDGLLAEIPQARYPALTGRIEWIAGTIDKVQGRVQSSVRRYEHAAAALQRSGGDGAAAFVSVLLAESYSLIGEHSLGWQDRFFAFHRVPFAESLRRNIAMWIEAKEALLRQGDLGLAGPFVEEAVAVADLWGRPLGRVTAYLDRAAYRLEIGAREAALADLAEAQRAVSEMEDSPAKEQVTYLTLITEGLCYQTSAPVKAASLLRRGLEGQKATGSRFASIDYTTVRAAAELAAGNMQTASASLEEAISIFEEIRSTVEDPVSRMQAFRQAQPAFDSLIRLRTAALAGDREIPFRLAERSRARVLLELRMRNGAPAVQKGFVSLAELEKTLPDGVALASYAVLEDQILVWVVENARARMLILGTDRDELSSAIERFRLEMLRKGGEAALQEVAGPLYDALIRPLELAPRRGKSLIIVPDRWLARLPFAALFDRQTGQYLIEQRAVTIVPSATLLVRGPQARRISGQPGLSVLAVGVHEAGSFSGRFFPSLPHAAREAGEVADVYARSSILLDAEATKENFLRMSVLKDVVHFAGHAMVDLESPRRSVLLFAGRSGGSLEPLTLGELFGAGLNQVSLVVLSACRTQDGLANDREGLLGIAGAFFAAGVPEVVASPWDVDDRATVPVMVAFHREYRLHRWAGTAFRQAVLGLLRAGSPEVRSPASWGGFTVIAGILDEEVSSANRF